MRTYVNASRVVEAPRRAGESLFFNHWSDGGASQLAITIGAEDAVFMATYTGTDEDGLSTASSSNEDVDVDNGVVLAEQPAPSVVKSTLEVIPAPEGGARLLLQAGERYEGMWSMVQWQDGNGQWQDVQGWSGEIKDGQKRWWVSPDLYGNGPFRWLLAADRDGQMLAVSKPFKLPSSQDEMIVWRVQ